jgi:protein Tex
VVERILARIGKGMMDVMGQPAVLKGLSPADFTDEQFGVPTVRDILTELEKPGRDPRPEFKTATFQEGVESLTDLQPGMILEGVVTNVAAFGAFVDVGVHQDGLVHVSALANKFVKDPHEVVKPGQIVKVKVLEVDVKRQRISLTMRLDDVPGMLSTSGRVSVEASTGAARDQRDRRPPPPQRAPERQPQPAGTMAMALALARAKQKK